MFREIPTSYSDRSRYYSAFSLDKNTKNPKFLDRSEERDRFYRRPDVPHEPNGIRIIFYFFFPQKYKRDRNVKAWYYANNSHGDANREQKKKKKKYVLYRAHTRLIFTRDTRFSKRYSDSERKRQVSAPRQRGRAYYAAAAVHSETIV